MPLRRTLVLPLAALAISACARPTSTTTSTSAALPTPDARPTQSTATPQPTLDPTQASPAELENNFLSHVDDLIAETADLTVTPCADLTAVTRDNPNLLPSIHGFAAAAKRVAATQAALNTDAVKLEMSDLDHSVSQFDGALSQCGIKQP